jgi:hypothetical protein
VPAIEQREGDACYGEDERYATPLALKAEVTHSRSCI